MRAKHGKSDVRENERAMEMFLPRERERRREEEI